MTNNQNFSTQLNTSLVEFSKITENYEDMTFSVLYSIYSELSTTTNKITIADVEQFLMIDYNFNPLEIVSKDDTSKLMTCHVFQETTPGLQISSNHLFADWDDVIAEFVDDDKSTSIYPKFNVPDFSAIGDQKVPTNISDIYQNFHKRIIVCTLIHHLNRLIISKKNSSSVTMPKKLDVFKYSSEIIPEIANALGVYVKGLLNPPKARSNQEIFEASVEFLENLCQILKTNGENIVRLCKNRLNKITEIEISKTDIASITDPTNILQYSLNPSYSKLSNIIENYIYNSKYIKLNKITPRDNFNNFYGYDEVSVRLTNFYDRNVYQCMINLVQNITAQNITAQNIILPDVHNVSEMTIFMIECIELVIHDYLDKIFNISNLGIYKKLEEYTKIQIKGEDENRAPVNINFLDILKTNIAQLMLLASSFNDDVLQLCVRTAHLLNVNSIGCYSESDTVRATLDFIYFLNLEKGEYADYDIVHKTDIKYDAKQNIYSERIKSTGTVNKLININSIIRNKFQKNMSAGYGKPNNSNLCEMISSLSKKYENRLPHNKNILEMYCSHLVAFSIDEGKCSSVSDVRKYLTNILNSKDISNQINEYLNEIVNNLNILKRQSTDYQFNYSDEDSY